MENTENSWKTRILSSFLFAVFTQTVPDGEDQLNMIEGVKLEWFFVIRSFQAVPKTTKNTKNWFSHEKNRKLRNYYATWWFLVKTDITTEFSVVDLVETESYSPVSSNFEKQSRMCFDQIHIKPTYYRPLKDVLLSHVTSSRLFKYKFWKPSKNAIRWYA